MNVYELPTWCLSSDPMPAKTFLFLIELLCIAKMTSGIGASIRKQNNCTSVAATAKLTSVETDVSSQSQQETKIRFQEHTLCSQE